MPLSSTLLGLERIEYSVAPDFVGTAALTFNQSAVPSGDFVETTSNTTSNYFLPAVVNGAIVVTPEPGSLVLMLLGAAALFGFGWLRRHRAC